MHSRPLSLSSRCSAVALASCAAFVLAACASTDHDWTAFRGPNGDGISHAKAVPTSWSATKNILWKAPLPRASNGSAIVSKGRVFLACTEDEGGKKRALYCFDANSGDKLWSKTVSFDKVMPTHKTNPYCGSTPLADGERVIVWHSSAGLHCYDYEGKELWSRDLGEFSNKFGYGVSPILHDGKVILYAGPGDKIFVTALDPSNGETIWRTDEPVKTELDEKGKPKLWGSWCTPVVAKVDGKHQIVCAHPSRVVAYDPDDGEIIWWCDGLTCKRGNWMHASPVIAGNTCLAIAGWDGPSIGIDMSGARGDVTKTKRLWRHLKRPSNVGSGVFVDGYIYWPDQRGVLACIDPKTGERTWTKSGAKGQIWGSIVYAGGHLYALNQRGKTVVFRPNSKALDVVAVNELGPKARTNATPAFADGRIYIRCHDALYCIAKPLQ